MNLLEVYTQLAAAAANLSQMFDEFGGELPDQPAIALEFVKADIATIVETVRQIAANELLASAQPGDWVVGKPCEKVEAIHAHLMVNGSLSEYVETEEVADWTSKQPTVEQRYESLEERCKRLEAAINILLMKNELNGLVLEG